jgi:hypothetical protein
LFCFQIPTSPISLSFQVSGKAATNNTESAEETAVEVRETISLPTIIGKPFPTFILTQNL